MAYITSYTLHQLTRSLANSKRIIPKEEFIAHVYKDPRVYEYLNNLERSYFFNFTQILKEPIKYLNHVKKRPDTGTYVRERESKLVYHIYPECELLNKDFIGFRIPLEVQELDLIEQFREWFEKNKFIEKFLDNQIRKDAILFQYNLNFAPKYDLPKLNEDYKLIDERLNSGHEFIDEKFNLQDFYKEISNWVYQAENRLPISAWKLLGKWHSFGNKSLEEIADLLDRLDIDHNFRRYNTVETIKEVLKEHHAAVIKLMRLLRVYFCWTYKLDGKPFDIVTLEHFNLKCCSQCEEVGDSDLGTALRESKEEDNDLPF